MKIGMENENFSLSAGERSEELEKIREGWKKKGTGERGALLAFASARGRPAGRNGFASPKNTFAPLISFAARHYTLLHRLLLSNRESHS